MTIEATHPVQATKPRQIRTAGFVTFLLAVGIPIVGIVTADVRGAEVAPGLGDWIFVGIVGAVAIGTSTIFVPWALRGNRSKTAGIVVSGFAFATSFVAFWTMIPLILGAAGALIGYETTQDDDAGSRPVVSLASIVLGVIAVVVSVAATIATS
jgi:succinate dehydrogenase hydrophobic anchor subunit